MSRSSNKIVTIVVVTSGAGDYLRKCLDSLRLQSYPASEVIVIDNSRSPGLAGAVAREYPEVKLRIPPENLFYGRALNMGIEMSRGDFVLCLNDDVILDKDFISRALNGFEVSRGVGMVCGKTLRFDAQTIDSTGLFLSPWLTAKDRGYGRRDNGQYDKEGRVFGVSGAVAFYRKAMLESIKAGHEYFDSDYGMFYEDLDLAWRAEKSGWSAYYVPSALAYHARGVSARAACGMNRPYARRYLSDNLHYDLIKNRYLTIIKNGTWLNLLLRLPFFLLYDILSWLYVIAFRPAVLKRFFLNPGVLKSAFGKRAALKQLLSRA